MKDILDFLSKLKQNNHKQWFDDNRKRYQELRAHFLDLLNDMIHDISEFDESLAGVEAKNCIFRINRDIRFSKDKTPYKTNFGAHLGELGRKTEGTGYYISVEPGNSIIGGGIYMPPPDKLAAIRQEIDYNPDELKKVIDDPVFKSMFGSIQGESLKTAPKGYPKDHPNIELLRLKSYYVIRNMSDKDVLSSSYSTEAIKTFKMAREFNNYLNVALD